MVVTTHGGKRKSFSKKTEFIQRTLDGLRKEKECLRKKIEEGQDRGQTPRSCCTTASTIHLGHHMPRTTELDTSAPEHLHFSPPHKCTQRAERDLLYWDL
ncbi:UNVERIFIED_CONTAM: hypothetical protein FKN15_073611 [Acipenser sinensis]